MATATDTVLETAINLVVEADKATRAGDLMDPVHDRMQEAVTTAYGAGYSNRDVHGAADRRYGQWLIDNADRYR